MTRSSPAEHRYDVRAAATGRSIAVYADPLGACRHPDRAAPGHPGGVEVWQIGVGTDSERIIYFVDARPGGQGRT
jgi:hypothetical protein